MNDSLRRNPPLPRGRQPRPAAALEKLKAERVEVLLKSTPGWGVSPLSGQLVRRFALSSHAAAAAFAQWIFALSQRRRQFPVVRVQRSEVVLSIGEVEAPGLTLRDFELARQIGQAVAQGIQRGSRGGQPTTSPS